MKTETDFNKLIAGIADEGVRLDVCGRAWENAFAVEVWAEYSSDEERWDVAYNTAAMIIDTEAVATS